jgi:hypothetical protein
MKALKKLTMLVLAIGMTASLAACDMLTGFLGGNSESEVSSDNNQTSEVESTGKAFTEEEFNTALQLLYSQTNLAVVITDGQQTVDNVTAAMSGKFSYADGKFYSETTLTENSGFSESAYTYVGEVDGEYYQWTSDNKSFWDYDEMDAGESTATYVKELLDEIFVWCNFDYDQFNEKTGMMEFTGLNSPTVGVKIVDGKIVEFRFEEVNGDWYLATVGYGNATVGQLPALD